MAYGSVYNLPRLINNRYMLTAVLRETADTVVYAATQQVMRREVAVESLRSECMADPAKVQSFLEKARAQTRMGGKFVATALELIYAENTWHLVRERIKGEPLEELIAAGTRLSAAELCEFMLCLARNCIIHDMEGVATDRFSLHNAIFKGLSFRFDNLATSGPRTVRCSEQALTTAAAELPKLLDTASPMADEFMAILDAISATTTWVYRSFLDLYEDLVRLQLVFMQLNAKL